MKMKTYMTKSRMLLSCIHLIHGKKFLQKVISVCGWFHINAKKKVVVFCFYIFFHVRAAGEKKKFEMLKYHNVMSLFCAISALDISRRAYMGCIWCSPLACDLSRRCWRRHIATYRLGWHRILCGTSAIETGVAYIYFYTSSCSSSASAVFFSFYFCQ